MERPSLLRRLLPRVAAASALLLGTGAAAQQPGAAAQQPGGAARQHNGNGQVERSAAQRPRPPALSDTALALHLLERATFGARPADLAAVLREGRTAWLDRQLHPERIDDSALPARLAEYPAAGMTVAELYRQFPPAAAVKRLARADSASMAARSARRADAPPMTQADSLAAPGARRAEAPALTPADSMAMLADARRPTTAPGRDSMRRALRAAGFQGPARMIGDFVGARLAREIYSERQLQEVMTDFWFNHFNVFVRKGPDRYLVSRYEQEAIRPYVFGRFEDMLRATASHPAMLVYLDNWMSAVPDTTSPQYLRRQEQMRRFAALTPDEQQALVASGRLTEQQLTRLRQVVANAGRRKAGINENYARELMELHTLGVDGGYTQQDVVAVARAFTGWTLTRPGLGPNAPAEADVRFVFRPELHDRGEKVVLGTPLRPGRGMEDGLDVLHMLATSPATAQHIAFELVQHFVSDQPDSAMVRRIARVFLDSDGDLRAVTRALFTDPGFDDPRYVGTKVKTPLELVVSALRATGAEVGPGPSRGVLQTLRTLGELPYDYSFPTGYPAAAAEWVNSGALLNRMNFALALAAGRLDHVRIDPARFDAPGDPVHTLATAFLPGRDTRQLEAQVGSLLSQENLLQPRARLARAAGLILGSPDFQKR